MLKWFQAGEDLTFDIELIVGGVPAQPDAGTTSVTVRDQSGQVLADLDHKPITVPGTTASISVPAGENQIAAGSDTETRYVTLSYISGGQSRQQTAAYGLHPFLPIEASQDAVRSLLGVASDELPDDDIELVPAYYDLVADNGDAFKNAFTTGNRQRQQANRALALRAALDALPSLQLRVFQARTSENNSFGRFQTVDFQQLRADLTDQLAAALNIAVASTVAVSVPTLFVVSTPTDPVTNT
jgi:hypothetical protein